LFFRNVRWVRLFGYFMAVVRSLPQASTGLLFFVFAAESLRCI
jgi:hypothetical protein